MCAKMGHYQAGTQAKLLSSTKVSLLHLLFMAYWHLLSYLAYLLYPAGVLAVGQAPLKGEGTERNLQKVCIITSPGLSYLKLDWLF